MYQKKGLYFLDEPEAALSPKTQLDLLGLLNDISASGDSQFIISTHSPILMSCQQAEIYSFDDQSIERIAFTDTLHYRVYKEFFNQA
jgi:predicted ATPase